MYNKHKGMIWVLCNPDLYITTIGLFTLLSSNYSQTKSVFFFFFFFKYIHRYSNSTIILFSVIWNFFPIIGIGFHTYNLELVHVFRFVGTSATSSSKSGSAPFPYHLRRSSFQTLRSSVKTFGIVSVAHA